jgi:hypothetical protein
MLVNAEFEPTNAPLRLINPRLGVINALRLTDAAPELTDARPEVIAAWLGRPDPPCALINDRLRRTNNRAAFRGDRTVFGGDEFREVFIREFNSSKGSSVVERVHCLGNSFFGEFIVWANDMPALLAGY